MLFFRHPCSCSCVLSTLSCKLWGYLPWLLQIYLAPNRAVQVPQQCHCICSLAALRALRPPPKRVSLQWDREGVMVSCAPDDTCWKLPSTRHFQRAVLQSRNSGLHKLFQVVSQKKQYKSLMAIWLHRCREHWSTTQHFTRRAGVPEKVNLFLDPNKMSLS